MLINHPIYESHINVNLNMFSYNRVQYSNVLLALFPMCQCGLEHEVLWCGAG